MAERDPDPYVMYTVVRKSLNMSTGKVGAQCQHAMDYLTREVERTEITFDRVNWKEELTLRTTFRAWRDSQDHAKVVLGANDEEFEQVKLENPRHFPVVDLGYTQVAPNTVTCLGLWPMRKSQRSPILQKLRPL
jgi:peptidyl-tRNA hydrolase